MADTQADAFTARFAAAWRQPTPERLVALLTDDVTLIQPLTPTTHGKPAARTALERLLGLVGDLHAEVLDHWGRGDDRVVIEFDLVGTLGGRELRWRLIDVFELRGDLARQRRSYFDPAPVVVAILTRPRAWLAYLRSGLWRR